MYTPRTHERMRRAARQAKRTAEAYPKAVPLHEHRSTMLLYWDEFRSQHRCACPCGARGWYSRLGLTWDYA
jgi:hypothetical protein